MKKLSLLPIVILALLVSCEKPASEADRNAQIEQEVQRRLDAERQAQDRERLAQQQTDLEARERALAEKEAATSKVAAATPRATARPIARDDTPSVDRRGARSYDTFYRKLDPYGAWRETPDYGFVWQPRVAQQSRNWRPYTDGRWAYTDVGWTWVSNEPFGWAAYHYGRWTRLRGVGWVWVPGEEWAPAWVSWRTSNEHIGWAPLPPEARFERRTGIKKWADSYYDIGADEYVFIPNEDIGAENLERSVLPVDRNVTIVNQTTNVTNITYSNTTIINEGPNYDELRQHSRRPFERLRLQREYDIEESQTPQATVRGNVLAIMTPFFNARVTQRPRNLGAPIREATVERNWATDANQPDARRAREKMRSEATPPPNAPSKKFEKPVVIESTPPPAATPAPAATAVPVAPATPTPASAVSATPAPEPSASPTPRRPRSTPTPTPEATPPPATPTPVPVATATAEPTATPRPRPTAPIVTPPPNVIDPPVREPVEDQVKIPRGRDGRPPRAIPGKRGGREDEGDAAGREINAAPIATPPAAAEPVAPRAVTPPPIAEPEMSESVEKSEGGTSRLDDGRGERRPRTLPTPAPVVPEPRIEESVVPPAAAEKARPTDQDDASEDARPTPEGANEP